MLPQKRATPFPLETALGVHYPPPRDFFRKLRKRHQLSQREMAARLGITENTYQRWETGDAFPHLLTYAGVLAVSKAWPAPPAARKGRRRG